MATHADPGQGRLTVHRALIAGLLLTLSLSGCSGPDTAAVPSRPETTIVPPPAVIDGVRAVLHRRAIAVREHDRAAFLATVTPAARRQQAQYFDNLAQLPIQRFGYAVSAANVVRVAGGYWVVVEVRLELRGFDAGPALSPDRYFFRTGAKPGRLRLGSVTDAAWEERNDVRSQPWDYEPITVRSAQGVLGIFDDGSARSADQLMAALQAAVLDVSDAVPYAWSRGVVVYALSDERFLDALDPPPGGDVGVLDALAFAVPARPDGGGSVGTRVVLSPAALAADGISLGRLLRHELTHVALGNRDDHAPRWLVEGLAEYVSTRALAPRQRRVSAGVLDVLATPPSAMPADATFNDADAAVHYTLAWWACEYLARTYGSSMLWTLLDQFDRPTTPHGATRVLRAWTGLTSAELAANAAELLESIYRPDVVEPEPTPSPGATSPATSPTPSATTSPAASPAPGTESAG